MRSRPGWLVEADFTTAGAYHAAKQMLGDPRTAPSALFCASDEMAFGAIMAARDLGYRVPQDISVMGFDGHDSSEFFALTTISQNPRQMGARGADMLVDILESGSSRDLLNYEHTTEWPIELMVRGSTARRSAEA
jgi:LacI family transcriptional regulator, repressor for deo operon, udp, cdd, tsx, nupC, and nupG